MDDEETSWLVPDDELPDYVAWASHEALSPHSIACLMLGIVPPEREPKISRRRGDAPNIPDSFLDSVDGENWEADYEKIYMTLRSGIDNGKLSLMPNGHPSVIEAMEYLFEVGHSNNWPDSYFDDPYCLAVRNKRPSRVDALEADVATLTMQLLASEAELAACGKGRTYTTRSLDWMDRAIGEFYDNYPDECPTTEGVTNWIVEQSKAMGDAVTPTSAKRIAVLLTPDDRKIGGRRSRQ